MIFLELVPRDIQVLVDQAACFLNTHPQLTGINIPDIKRLPHRSLTVADTLLQEGMPALPHIRTQDASIETHIRTIETLYQRGLKQVLLISGDPVKQGDTYDTTPIMLTRALRERFSDLIIYCGIDPYRSSFTAEYTYAQEKLAAGANGLFSQPFFDLALLEQYSVAFPKNTLFAGISPVLTQETKVYWENINRVCFPASFEFDLNYNVSFAKDILTMTKQYKQHAYLMPIRMDTQQYLSEIFTR